jgi:hypothetical protein
VVWPDGSCVVERCGKKPHPDAPTYFPIYFDPDGKWVTADWDMTFQTGPGVGADFVKY